MPTISAAPSDGRAFTTYVSSGIENRRLMARVGATTETEYRHILQTNPHLVRPRLKPAPKWQ